jgi:hypothetical protein
MAASIGFVLGRAEATRAVLESLVGTWVWEDKTVEGWAADLTAVRAKQAQVEGLDQDVDRARADVEAAIKDLSSRTGHGLGMARAKYRKDPVTLGALSGLDAKVESRQDAIDDAVAWEEAWAKLPDPDWTPSPTNTRAAFSALRQAAAAKLEALNTLVAEERKARKELNQLVGELWEDCIAWYQAACLVFPDGTPEGRAIRAGIPTMTAASAAAPAAPTTAQ